MMMLKVLVYAYSVRVFSSRAIESRIQADIACRFLAAKNVPNHRAINLFRRYYFPAFRHLFIQVLEVARAAGLVKFGQSPIDGTKVRVSGGKHKAMSYDRMQKETTRLEQEIDSLIRRTDNADDIKDERYSEMHSGGDLPAELSRREARLARIEGGEVERALWLTPVM